MRYIQHIICIVVLLVISQFTMGCGDFSDEAKLGDDRATFEKTYKKKLRQDQRYLARSLIYSDDVTVGVTFDPQLGDRVEHIEIASKGGEFSELDDFLPSDKKEIEQADEPMLKEINRVIDELFSCEEITFYESKELQDKIGRGRFSVAKLSVKTTKNYVYVVSTKPDEILLINP